MTTKWLPYLFSFTLALFLAPASGFGDDENENGAAETQSPSNEGRVNEVSAFSDGGFLVFETDDGDFRWWVDGRIQLDGAMYAGGENELANGAELRRGRLALKMLLWRDWAAEFDVDVADNEIDIKDMWIANTALSSSLIKVGNHKEPFSMEELTSSRFVTFMERGLPNVFAPGRHLGISYARWGSRYYFSGGLFGDELSDVDETGEDEGFGVSSRFAFTPVRGDDHLVHLGVGTAYRTPAAGSDNRIRFRTRPETHVNRARFLNTGRIEDVDSYSLMGFEAAASVRNVSVQAEYVQNRVQRLNGEPDASLDGWYAFVSWFPTGESRPYDAQAAEFARVIPRRSQGALEIALRYSSLDLNDVEADVLGGKGENVTLGVNWYANPNIRILFNLTHATNDELADGDGDFLGNDSFNVAQFRFQLTF